MAEQDRVVIAGGGPVGMVMALALYKQGVPFTVLESLHEPFIDQRAASNHPPTVAMLGELGLADDIVPEGLKAPIFRIHDRVSGEMVAEFDLADRAFEINRRAGELIAQGASAGEAVATIGQVVEGLATAPVLRDLSHRLGVEMPIAQEVHAALFEGKSVQRCLIDLLSREQKDELAGVEDWARRAFANADAVH